MNIKSNKIINKNELNKIKILMSKPVYSNANNKDIDVEAFKLIICLL